MKKVFFTAIAMVAFSSASMANTIADEEVVVNNKEKKEIMVEKEVVVKKDCFAVALFTLDVVESFCGPISDEAATNLLNQAYHNCMTS